MPTPFLDAKTERRADALEMKIFKLKKQAAALRLKSKPHAVPDYVFAGHDGRPLKLSQAFGTRKDLIVIHNMGSS